MKLRVLGLVAALLLATPAMAALDVTALTQQYVADGYTRVEVKVGPTQVKVEAIKDGTKVEVVYDLASGDELKRESEVIPADESSATGVSVRTTPRDFIIDVSGGASGNDDAVDDKSGNGSDDVADDKGGGSDDDVSDDHGGGSDDSADHDSGDDHGGSGNSGSGSSGNDDSGDDSEDD